ncbi:MAG TPA: arylsulfatase [Phycisphaerae bacterium]|nr:arylsulfatase [Phycisphaerae bacterium]
MNRRRFLTSVGAGAAALAMPGRAAAATGGKPNIIFIIVDDMGYHDLGCYGSKTIKTPHIDRMAAEGMRFTDAYSGATVCAPARSTLMTGYHMGHTSVRGNSGGIPLLDEDVTVAEVLRAAGYATGGFGKWGLGDVGTAGVPEKQGFDVFFGYYHQVHAHSYYTAYLWRNSERVPLPGNEGGKRGQYSHHVIYDEAVKFIRASKDRPFFCYCPWTPPHAKYEFPQDDPAWALYENKDWPNDAKVAAAMDSMMDRQVGEIIALLVELGLDSKTIIFFCSDNGAAKRFDGIHNSCGQMKGFKRSMQEGGIRTPMIVRWPGKIRAGVVSDFAWYFPDVMPTLAELAGAGRHVPKGIDGISVVPTLLGEAAAGRSQQPHDYMFWENGGTRAARMGKWKAIRKSGGKKQVQAGPVELYDLSADLGESNNLAAQHPDVAGKMADILEKAYTPPRPQVEPKKPKGKGRA